MASATSNSFVNPPRLPSPTKGRIHARKPSRSPVRQDVRNSDALLRDLSPTSTLRAFVTDPSDMNSSSDALVASIRSATMSERGLGAKAAQTCLDLRNWAREVEHWEWPGTFQEPEPARKRMRLSKPYDSLDFRGTSVDGGEDEEEYWGSLPARVVQEYERRADEIGQGLDEIEVEELKDYVLTSHYRVNSRPPSRGDSFGEFNSKATDFRKLDDFTALVTATILQALPFLSQLNRLLDVWTMRLIILRGIPRFLHDLKRAKTDLDSCWAAIAAFPSNDSADFDNTEFTCATIRRMKANIEQQIGTLGRRLDRFLDDLEGREECVPDVWIDEFEALESAYSAFIVQAERIVAENEWREQHRMLSSGRGSASASAVAGGHNGLLSVSEVEDPMSDDDAVRRLSQSICSSADETQAAQLPKIPGPSHNSPTGSVPTQVAKMSANQPWVTSNRSVSVPLSMSSQYDAVVVADENGNVKTTSAGDGISRSASATSRSKEEATVSVSAKRAAFIRDIERSQSLNKSTQSPVRPFERASNAFTRLFKNEKAQDQVLPRRIGSRLAGESAQRGALSPVSFASSRFNSVSPTTTTQWESESSKSSVNGTDDSETRTLSVSKPIDHVDANSKDKGKETAPFAEKIIAEALSRSNDSNGNLSSPFHSPDKEDFPEEWPLATLPERDTRSPAPSAARHPAMTEVESPAVAMDTDAFDRTFIESFTMPGGSTQGSTRLFKVTQHDSLPQSRRSSGDGSLLSNATIWASVAQDERRTSASPTRPNTAPSESPLATRYHVSLPERSSNFSGEHLQARAMPLTPAGKESFNLRGTDAEISDGEVASLYKVKRASVASIEAFSRSELKSIDVPKSSRQGSGSSRRSPSRTPADHSRRASTIGPSCKSAFVDNGGIVSSAVPAPTIPARRSSLPSQPSPLSNLGTPIITRSSPVMEQFSVSPVSPSAPLNMVMKKLRSSKNAVRLEDSPSVSSSSPTNSPVMPVVHADHFDRHVSEVLETLPGSIRFNAGPGAETAANSVRNCGGPRPKASTTRVPPRGGDTLTIAPADSSPKKSRSAADSEVKLYHLTHTGREDPIKLFVRLVGEGERVMVRVGGGWADLADYLRDFANHHGSRTVSEGNLEVAALPTAPLSARKTSNPAEYIGRAKTPTTPREAVRPGSSEDDHMPLKLPPSDRRGSAVSVSNTSIHAGTTTSSTPKSAKSGSSGSRPSTANASRPSSRQAQISATGDVGLAGPSSASKRAGLPAEKERWIEGMIERAKKSASAEKSREDREKHFSELGKAGGTRRVIFRSGSGTGPGPLQDKSNR